jgi:hypothetical protein
VKSLIGGPCTHALLRPAQTRTRVDESYNAFDRTVIHSHQTSMGVERVCARLTSREHQWLVNSQQLSSSFGWRMRVDFSCNYIDRTTLTT